VLGSSSGRVMRYNIVNGNVFSDENKANTIQNADAGIVALSMDDLN
jgi:hypothetical protein